MSKKALLLMLGICVATCTLTIGGLAAHANADTTSQTVKNTDQIHKLKIDVPSKVIVKTGSEFKVQSKFPDKQKTTVINKDDQIKISHPQKKNHLWGIKIDFKQPKSVVNVTVPKNMNLTNLKINSKAADVQLDSSIENLTIASHSGDVHLTKTNPQKLTVKSESGDINLNQIKVQNDSQLFSESGDIDLNNSHFKNMTADSESGNIKAHDLFASVFNFNSESGDVNISNQKTINYDKVTINSDSGDVLLKNAKVNQSNIDTDGGDLDLPKTKIKHANNSTD